MNLAINAIQFQDLFKQNIVNRLVKKAADLHIVNQKDVKMRGEK